MLHLLIQCILWRVERDTFSHFPRPDKCTTFKFLDSTGSICGQWRLFYWLFSRYSQLEVYLLWPTQLRRSGETVFEFVKSLFRFLNFHFFDCMFLVLHSCSGPFWHSRNSWHSRNARHTRPSRSQRCKRRTRRDWSEGRSWRPGLFKLETMCLARGWWPGFWNDWGNTIVMSFQYFGGLLGRPRGGHTTQCFSHHHCSTVSYYI